MSRLAPSQVFGIYEYTGQGKKEVGLLITVADEGGRDALLLASRGQVRFGVLC
jgi:hypothetical protein